MEWHDIVLNEKHADWIRSTETNIFSILEGGVRSGKTTSMILAFCRLLEQLPFEGLHVAFAESISLARMILMEGGNNLGIKSYFGENAREGQYKGKDALYIKIRNLTQVVVFVGSKNSDAFKSIRGLTVTSVIGTEVNLAHRTFMEEIVARTLMTPIKYRRLLFDLNPTMDSHYIYTEFIDRWVKESDEGTLLGGVNYDTCSIFENPAITQEQIENILSQYDKNSPVYKALILGLRMNSADVVYILYDYNLKPVRNVIKPLEHIIVVDVGISLSATTFISMGKAIDGKIYIYDEYYHRNGKDKIIGAKEHTDYCDDLVEFYRKQVEFFGTPPRYVFIDRDVSFLRILTRKFMENSIPKSKIQYVIKDKINERITTTRNLLYTGNIVVDETLEHTPKALRNAVYDPKSIDKGKLERLDDTELEFNPIDVVDAVEYGVSYFEKYK